MLLIHIFLFSFCNLLSLGGTLHVRWGNWHPPSFLINSLYSYRSFQYYFFFLRVLRLLLLCFSSLFLSSTGVPFHKPQPFLFIVLLSLQDIGGPIILNSRLKMLLVAPKGFLPWEHWKVGNFCFSEPLLGIVCISCQIKQSEDTKRCKP